MIRRSVIAAAACLAACGEAPPMPSADRETIAYAVERAQAQADKASDRGAAASGPRK